MASLPAAKPFELWSRQRHVFDTWVRSRAPRHQLKLCSQYLCTPRLFRIWSRRLSSSMYTGIQGTLLPRELEDDLVHRSTSPAIPLSERWSNIILSPPPVSDPQPRFIHQLSLEISSICCAAPCGEAWAF